MSAEYIMAGGNEQVILCERGIRTFETATRNTLDLSAVPVLHKLTHLPVAVDPSHGTGVNDLVHPMALAAVAAILYSCAYTQISPTMGGMLGLKAFVAAVLGGIGSIPGAMLGGILIGICETLTKAYISSSFADAIVFGILIVVLIIRPSGLLGEKTKEKV